MPKESVNIPLGDKYVVTADGYSYVLKEVKTIQAGAKKGETMLINVGYFQTLSGLAKGLLNKEVRETDIQSLEQMQTRIEELGEGISHLLNNIFNELTKVEKK